MSGIDLSQELADLRAVFETATGDVGDLRDAGRIAWPGEPFIAPDPSGDIAAPASWLDIDFGRIGSDGDTFGVEMAATNLDVAVCVEPVTGAGLKALALCDALKTLFQGIDTTTMAYYPWRAFPAGEGLWDDRWYRIDYQIPYERRESI